MVFLLPPPTEPLELVSDLPCVSESLVFPLGLCVGDCDNDVRGFYIVCVFAMCHNSPSHMRCCFDWVKRTTVKPGWSAFKGMEVKLCRAVVADKRMTPELTIALRSMTHQSLKLTTPRMVCVRETATHRKIAKRA